MTQANASGDAFNDSLNFVKKLWGQMGVPGMPGAVAMPGMTIPGMPTMPLPSMSLEDLDKRIQELKTVETWLNVNMTMLRNTIQALEVQRATIATLHSLSTTMANTMQGLTPGEGRAGYAFPSSPAPAEKPVSESAHESTKPTANDKAENNADDVSPLVSQSAVWWQSVQDQFKQALGTALEKSVANYETLKSSSENIVKATTTNFNEPAAKTKAAPKTSSKTSPKAAPKAATSVRKTASRSAAKPAGKAKP